jgi:hypothetical protein
MALAIVVVVMISLGGGEVCKGLLAQQHSELFAAG